MYDVLTRSTIFGLRNADKVINTNDKGRIFADIGQFTNAAKAAAHLDNKVGKGAQAAINAVNTISQNNKALSVMSKGANWASKNVNPLLIGAAGYRVLTAKDKETTLKREIVGMSAMFGVEALIKEFFKSSTYATFKAQLCTKPWQKALCSIIEGILFVSGSIAASTTGYKIGEKLYQDKTTKTTNPPTSNNSIINTTDESEYFLLKNNKALA